MFQALLPSHEPWILPSILMLARRLEAKGLRLVRSPLHRRVWRKAARVAGLAGIGKLPFRALRGPAFFQINHPWPDGLYPYRSLTDCVTYSFDCWPPLYDQWEKFFREIKPRLAFISAKASMAEMARRCPETTFRWMPEALDPDGFPSDRPLIERTIDVLEMGRRFDSYHAAIRPSLAASGKTHLFAMSAEHAPFSYAEAIAHLGDSKIAICFPRTMTHPQQAGEVETTTFRYFEAIFSRCLMIGHCPAELEEILGFNPVIPANLEAPGEQITREILPNLAAYQSLVDNNYARAREKWTVDHQADLILAALKTVS